MKIRKILIATICGIGLISHAPAQTLFTYGKYPVDKKEFLNAYNKNPDTTADRAEKMRQYLDLYINFRLKLQSAYDEGVDSSEQIKNEADNFRDQLVENYINDQADIRELMHEAFLRNKKDVLVQQVFVQVKPGTDTTAAYAQISKAYSQLKAGKNFDSVASKSSDSAVRESKGMIGYVTVFTLPYAIENIVYSLQPGAFSTIYKSGAGYHIFKNVAERPALGRRKVQQLLFPILPFFNNEQKAVAGAEADSVYNVLQKGGAFTPLLATYGHNTEEQEGNTIEVKVGEYNSNFENEVFSLKKAGDFTPPFKTEYGYNIIKAVEIIPPVSDENDVESAAYLQEEIKKDGRLDVAKQKLVAKWLTLTHFKEAKFNRADLWEYTDSALKLEDTLPESYKGFKPSTTLCEFEKKKIPVSDWISYVRFMQMVTKIPAHTQYEKMIRDFMNGSCEAYYKDNIEDFVPSIREQLKEFNDANMLFYVMDKHVWSKAPEDSDGLKNYYKDHADQYKWNKSLSAIVISGPDKSVVEEIAGKVKSKPAEWRSIVAGYTSSIYADSSRFEADQLPVKQPLKFEKDFQTEPEANDAGDAFTFVHVMKIYSQPEPRSFEEARGLVINDYQQQLEKEWLDQLKKTYPVKVDEQVFKSIQ